MKVLLSLLALLFVACSTEKAPALPPEHETEEVADQMIKLQRYAEKLYWSRENPNLRKFYLHELEEVAEEVVEAKITDDGHNLSKYMTTHLLPTIEQLEHTTDFDKDYKLLVQSCNNCHAAAAHAFIKIKVPEVNRFSNQEF